MLDHKDAVEIVGVGVGTTGFINREKGFLTSLNLGVNNLPLKGILEEELELPVEIDNDCNAGALGEGFFGAAREKENYIYITIGTGIGAGLVFNKRFYRGYNHHAGELGHLDRYKWRKMPVWRKGMFGKHNIRSGD